MLRLGRKIREILFGRSGQQGQALVTALIALGLGALIITPTLSYTATGVKSTAIRERITRELYAADAGMEYAMWRLTGNVTSNFQITVDGIPVDVTVGELAELPYGPVITGDGEHVEWLRVWSQLTDTGDNLTFTLTVFMFNEGGSGTPPIKLDQIGMGMPQGFSYVNGSSSGVTTANPTIDGKKLTWNLGTPKPEIDYGETSNQTCRISRPNMNYPPMGQYSWVDASREDVGLVSTCRGYSVTARAGGITIEADIVYNQGSIFPVSWKIN